MFDWIFWSLLQRSLHQEETRASPVASNCPWLLAGAILLFVLGPAAVGLGFLVG
jgi:hypothetical protein